MAGILGAITGALATGGATSTGTGKGILGNLVGSADINVVFDKQSSIRLGVVAIVAGLLLIIFSKLINKIF